MELIMKQKISSNLQDINKTSKEIMMSETALKKAQEEARNRLEEIDKTLEDKK